MVSRAVAPAVALESARREERGRVKV